MKVDFNQVIGFSWGDTIYTGRPDRLDRKYLAHEMVHLKQQCHSRLFGFFCIIRYMYSHNYRLKCEIEACRASIKEGETVDSMVKAMKQPIYGFKLSSKEIKKLLCKKV
jgi:hypothetical protein